jgi:CheY-like chemotaxis protein
MPDGKLAAGSRTAGPVLLVEDDADLRSALAELLHDEGYDFIMAEHGLDALEALDRQTPSLLLTDLLMPIMNGVELIARLRDEPRWADLPIVVMTAAGDRIIGAELEGLNLPVLKKPVDVADLAQVLARYSGTSAEQTRSV